MPFIVLTSCACWPLLLLACLLESVPPEIFLLTVVERLDSSYVQCAVAGARVTAISGKVVGKLGVVWCRSHAD